MDNYSVFGVACLDDVLSSHLGDDFHGSVDDIEDSACWDGSEESECVESEGIPKMVLSDPIFITFFDDQVGFEGHVVLFFQFLI